jgi:hypothetical protein
MNGRSSDVMIIRRGLRVRLANGSNHPGDEKEDSPERPTDHDCRHYVLHLR